LGKLGAEEAVTVFSHDAAVAIVLKPNSNETISPAAPEQRFTRKWDERCRL
jgi:hypothetical protein